MIKKVTNTVPWAYISKFNVDKINYFPEPYTHSKKKIVSNLSNYPTKSKIRF